MARNVALTTKDNPFDYFTQFDAWYSFDIGHGYNSCGVLARFARTSDALSADENMAEIENKIDYICKIDPRFKKVVTEVPSDY